jgi:hypothetical protein
VKSVSQSFATSADLPADLAAHFRAGVPLVRYLCNALGVPF